MYKKNIKFNLKFVGLFILVLGIIYFAIAIVCYINEQTFLEQAVKTNAVISRILSGSGKVFVEYTVDGINYETQLNSYSSSWTVGKVMEIYYQIDDPTNIIEIHTLFILYIVFFSLGGVFVVGGIITLLLMGKSKKLKKLTDTGIRVSCVIQDVKINKNISVCGVHPYKIKAISPTGEVYNSKNIYEEINAHVGDRVDVYYDENKPRHYYFDEKSIKNNIF